MGKSAVHEGLCRKGGFCVLMFYCVLKYCLEPAVQKICVLDVRGLRLFFLLFSFSGKRNGQGPGWREVGHWLSHQSRLAAGASLCLIWMFIFKPDVYNQNWSGLSWLNGGWVELGQRLLFHSELCGSCPLRTLWWCRGAWSPQKCSA